MWQQINDSQGGGWQVVNAAEFIFNVTNDGGYSFGSFSSGPLSGIGGDVVVEILSGGWVSTNNSQSASSWSVIQT